MKKLTTYDFIGRAINIHGNRYDYSLVKYKNNKTKVKIICPIHGIFEQRPNDHLMNHGCPICGDKSAGNKNRMLVDVFIGRALSIHDDKYLYDLVEYKNSDTKVKIICPEHGVFEQRPANHLNGHGCPECRYIKSARSNSITTEEFIGRALSIHGDRYDYSLVEYTNNKTKVKIICPIHGVFEQTPVSFLINSGCPVCFGSGCNSSGYGIGASRLTLEEFVNDAVSIHGDKYDYSLVDYIGTHSKVKIICPEHGVFEQTPANHKKGSECPQCRGIVSKQEMSVVRFIKSIYNKEVITNIRSVITPYELDVYLPDINMAFEYNGRYWHQEGVTKPIGYHQMKTDMCKKHGIELHHIWEVEWRDNRDRLYQKIKKQIYEGL